MGEMSQSGENHYNVVSLYVLESKKKKHVKSWEFTVTLSQAHLEIYITSAGLNFSNSRILFYSL